MKKAIELFKNLELNKQTKDVEIDFEHINVGKKIKFFSFAAAVSIFCIGTFYYVMQDVKTDRFRKALVERVGVAPLMTYTYSTFQDEAKAAQAKLDEDLTLTRDLQSRAMRAQYGEPAYNYTAFLKDVASGKVEIPEWDEKIKKNDAYKTFARNYILAYLVQNAETKININGTDYAIIAVMGKLQSLSTDVAKEAIAEPAAQILPKIALPKDEFVKEALSEALMTRLNGQDANFYSKIDLNTTEYHNIVELIKTATLKGERVIKIVSNATLQKTFAIPMLDAEFNAQAEKEKELAAQKVATAQSEKDQVQKQLDELTQKQAKYRQLISLVASLQSTPEKYGEISSTIKSLISELKL